MTNIESFHCCFAEGVNVIAESKVNSVSKKGKQVELSLDNGLKVITQDQCYKGMNRLFSE